MNHSRMIEQENWEGYPTWIIKAETSLQKHCQILQILKEFSVRQTADILWMQ